LFTETKTNAFETLDKISKFAEKYMAKLLVFMVALSFLTFSCKIQAPQFKNVADIKIDKASFSEIELSGNALLRNPNFLGAKVLAFDLEVYESGKLIGAFGERSPFRIKSKRDFLVPLRLSIKTSSLSMTTAANLLGGKADFEYRVNAKVRYFLFKRSFKMTFKNADLKL
jgi:LEA14-like dessication related protein